MAATTENTELLTARDLAQQLQVKETTVRRWVKEERIPVIRLTSRVLRFRESDVMAALGVIGGGEDD